MKSKIVALGSLIASCDVDNFLPINDLFVFLFVPKTCLEKINTKKEDDNAEQTIFNEDSYNNYA